MYKDLTTGNKMLDLRSPVRFIKTKLLSKRIREDEYLANAAMCEDLITCFFCGIWAPKALTHSQLLTCYDLPYLTELSQKALFINSVA